MKHALLSAILLWAQTPSVAATDDLALHDGPATAVAVRDTSLWNSVERTLGLEHDYRTSSPMDACMLLRRDGLHLFKVPEPTPLDIALLHDVGCTVVLLSQYHFYVFRDLSFHHFTFNRELSMARRHSDLFWETVSGYRAIEQNEPGRPFDFELVTSRRDTTTFPGDQQLLSTLRKIDRHRYIDWRSDARYVKKQVHGVWAIAPHTARRVTEQTEALMNGLGLSLAFRPADIEPVQCSIDTATLATRTQADTSDAADTVVTIGEDTALVATETASKRLPVDTARPPIMPLTNGIVRPMLGPNSLQLSKGVRQAIGGNVCYWLSVLVENAVISPLAANVSTEEGAVGLLMLSMPVSIMRIAGAPTACAGASNVYEYRHAVDPQISDIQVWKPYAIGWGLTAASTVFTLLGTVGQSYECLMTGAVFAYARDVAWGVASVWSLVYALRGRDEARAESDKTMGIAPIRTQRGADGVALVVLF